MAPEKRYVTMEQHVCPVCGKTFDTGTILMDRRLRDSFESHTVTGVDLCSECQKLKDEDYVALVECDPEKTDSYTDDNGHVVSKPRDAYRTGNIVHMRRHAFEKIFTIPVPEGMVCYVEPEVFEKIKAMMPESQDADQES